jgi:hypothetical protein
LPVTYENIATTTLGSAAASITFSSIPATYTDLRLVLVGTSSTTNTQYVTFNNDTATNYSHTQVYGNGTAASSFANTNIAYIKWASDVVGASSTIPLMATLDVFSYAGSTNKTALLTNNQDLNGSGVVDYKVGLWRSTAAINRIDIGRTGGNFNAGTTATLYGIKNA